MEELISILKNAGLTDGEAKVYLALLTLGESKVGPVIKTSRISRSKVYDILERLIQKHIVSKVEKKGVFWYQALPPNTLLNIVKQKEHQLKREQELLQKALPQLAQLQPKQKINVVIYEGFEGFKAMIDRMIQEFTPKDVYEAMGISETTESMRHYARKIYEAQKIKKFKARSIFDEKGAYKIEERKTAWHEIRILPKGWHTPASFTVYGDTVGIHTGKEETIISIVIKNQEIAKSFRAAFEAMWKMSRPA